jgi:hypothetical protein
MVGPSAATAGPSEEGSLSRAVLNYRHVGVLLSTVGENRVSTVSAGFVRMVERFKSAGLGSGNIRAVLQPWALSVAVAALAPVGCGSPAATLEIIAPPTAIAGSPFTITVTAMVGSSRDTVINSPVQFTSSDSAAVLPGIYYFTANDAGSHTFTNGITLVTPGSQSITATVVGATALTATAKITVSAAATLAQLKVNPALRDR